MATIAQIPDRGPERLRAFRDLHDAMVDDAVRTRRQLSQTGWSAEDIDSILDAYRAWLGAQLDAAFLEAAVVAFADEIGEAA